MTDNSWHVYLLRCADGTLYCGIARDTRKRLAQHNGELAGGARYTRGRRPVAMLASAVAGAMGDALRLEALIKKLPRYKKLQALVESG